MTDAKKYTGKLASTRILIIGGSSGIGFAVAEACLENGATVIISSSQSSRVESSVGRLLESYPSAKGRISGHPCDLSSPNLEQNIKKLFEKSGGKLDHIVCTAGDKLAMGDLKDITLENIQRAGMVRFNAVLLVGKHAPTYMNPGPSSSITLTTGSVSERPNPGWTVVASYAAGLHGMTRNLALDLAPIRVNLISPGMLKTELWDGVPKEQYEQMEKATAARLPTGRVAGPESVAEAYLYLMKDENCTGSMISSNGGHLLK
ncbi:MAG: hypothetical protein MMC33_002770 [Icmadophila ericetorum]|nr:hypothetical protein [Icmadophila ericetorum]